MKKLLSLVLVLAVVALVSGCKEEAKPDAAKIPDASKAPEAPAAPSTNAPAK